MARSYEYHWGAFSSQPRESRNDIQPLGVIVELVDLSSLYKTVLERHQLSVFKHESATHFQALMEPVDFWL